MPKKGGARKKLSPSKQKRQAAFIQRKQAERSKPSGLAMPPRPWRTAPMTTAGARKGLKTTDIADEILKVAGGHGTNVLSFRNREVKPEMISAANQDPTLDIGPSISRDSLHMLAMGIVLAAKKRGWNSQNDPGFQFQAYGYLIEIFRASIKGVTLEFTSAPRWFVELCAALRPKTHNYLTGRVQYEPFVAEIGAPLSSVTEMGTGPQAYHVVFGQSDSTNTKNGFPTLIPAGAYDPAVGAAQFSSMWNCFVAQPGTPSELISPTQEKPFNVNDCSAFAMTTSRLGTSYFSPGGLNLRLENEVHIDSPLLSKFCNDNDPDSGLGAEYRAGFNYGNGGGSPCYIGPRCLEFEAVDQFRNKGRPVFKFYNFDEYFEHFSMIIGGVLSRVAQQTTISAKQYPLTVLQTQVMLRQALLPFFSNEMAQDLRLVDPNDPVAPLDLLLPFVVGDNGVPQTSLSTGPEMPRFFTEMVKGVQRLTSSVKPKGVAGPDHQIMDWVPVLGRNVLWAQPGNYTYSDGAGNPLIYLPAPVSEVPMNLVECSVIDGQNTLYLNLNGDEYAAIVSAHNEWMTYMQPFMSGLTKLTASTGTPLLSSVICTRQSQLLSIPDLAVPVPQVTTQDRNIAKAKSTGAYVGDEKSERRKSAKDKSGYSIRKERPRARIQPIPGQSDEFLNYGSIAVHSNLPFIKELEKYSSLLIMPVVITRNDNFYANTGYIQSTYGEPLRIAQGSIPAGSLNSSATAATFPTMFSLHEQAAALDLKNIGSDADTEFEVLIDSLDANGQAGWLSALSKMLTTGSKIADTVSSLTGW